MKTNLDVMQILDLENISPLFRRMQYDMSLMVPQLLGQVIPFPEYKVGVRLTFPDSDSVDIGKIGDHIWRRNERHLLSNPNADDLAVKRQKHRVPDNEPFRAVPNSSDVAFHEPLYLVFVMPSMIKKHDLGTVRSIQVSCMTQIYVSLCKRSNSSMSWLLPSDISLNIHNSLKAAADIMVGISAAMSKPNG